MPNKFEIIKDFNRQTLSQLSFNLVKFYEVENIEIKYAERANVESGVWITINFQYKLKKYWVEGQNTDIAKRRFAELIKNILVKDGYTL